jgi:hypothetical protein
MYPRWYFGDEAQSRAMEMDCCGRWATLPTMTLVRRLA